VPSGEKIEKIDLIGYYEDVDLEGDGLYKQWHYSYHKCQIFNHIKAWQTAASSQADRTIGRI